MRKRFLFGHIIHLVLEFASKVSTKKFQDMLNDYDMYKSFVINNFMFGFIHQEWEHEIIRKSWEYLRKNINTNFIEIVKKLKGDCFDVEVEFPLVMIKQTKRGISMKRNAIPDIFFINHTKKQIIIIDIKTTLRYKDYTRQMKKYYKACDKLYPDYDVIVLMYLTSKDKFVAVLRNRYNKFFMWYYHFSTIFKLYF